MSQAAPAFPPAPSDPCCCGADATFEGCCGSRASDRLAPKGLILVENAIDPGLRERLLAEAERRGGERFRGLDYVPGTLRDSVEVDETTFYERVKLEDMRSELDGFVGEAFTRLVAQAYGARLDWYEEPKLLRYRPGGQFGPHADGAIIDPVSSRWKKTKDRDLSFLVYLDDEFTGGALSFPYFHYRLKPQAGLLVLFPSDIRFLHAAEPVESGVRHAIVSWASVQGVPKLHPEPPPHAIRVN